MYIYPDTCKSPANKVKTSSLLVVSATYPHVAEEIKSHKQTLHTKDDVRQDSCPHGITKSGFPENLHLGSFPEALFLVT